MGERCDACGHKFDVLSIVFTGSHFYCAECFARCNEAPHRL